MVYTKRILFLAVVISFLCNGLVECKRKEVEEEIQRDVNSEPGVIIDFEINKNREKRRATSLQKECIDCKSQSEDVIYTNQPHLRSKRGAKSKIRRKSKNRLKKKPTSSSSSTANSKSFSNYFSGFWKKDKSSPSTERSNSENLKNTKVKKASSGSTKQKTRKAKQKSLGDSKPKNKKTKSLVNYFSGYWEDDKKGTAKDSQDVKDVSKTKTGSKKKSKSKKESIEKSDEKEPSKTKEIAEGKSLLNHFSSFWEEDEDQDSSTKTNSKGMPEKISKPNNTRNKTKKKGRTKKERQERRKSKLNNATDKNEKTKGKDQMNKKRTGSHRENTKSNPSLKKENSEDQKVRNNKKTLTQSKDTSTGMPESDHVNRADMSSSDISKSKSHKIEKLKNPNVPDTKDSTQDIGRTEIEKAKERKVKIRKTKANRKRLGRKKNRKNKKKLTKADGRGNKDDDKDLKKQSILDAMKLNKKEETPEKSQKVDGKSDQSIVDFQGLKSGLNSNQKGDGRLDKEDTNQIVGKSNRDGDKLATTNIESKKPPVEDGTIDVSKEKITISIEQQNNKDRSDINRHDDNSSENVKKPTKILTITKVPKKKKKLKTSTKKLSYYELLLKAESDFRRRDERIKRKLSTLSKKTGKRYKQYQTLNEKHFNEVLPAVKFNFSHPKQQSETSKVSMADLKKMIIKINNDTDSQDVHDKPQGDDPMYDLNSLIDLSQRSRSKGILLKKDGRETENKYFSGSPQSQNDSHKVTGSFSFLNHYSSFWKGYGLDSFRHSKVLTKTKKSKRNKKKRKRRKKKQWRLIRKKQQIDIVNTEEEPTDFYSPVDLSKKSRALTRDFQREPVDTEKEAPDLNSLIDLSKKSRDKANQMQSDSPAANAENDASPKSKKRSYTKSKKSKSDKRKERRRKKKKDAQLKLLTAEVKEMMSAEEMENAESSESENDLEAAVIKRGSIVKEKTINNKNELEIDRDSTINEKKIRKKSKKGKVQNDQPTSETEFSSDVELQKSYSDDAYSRNYRQLRKYMKGNKNSKNIKSSRRKSRKSKRKGLKSPSSKDSRKGNRKLRRLRQKQSRQPGLKSYVNDEGIRTGSNYEMEDSYYDDRSPSSKTRLYRNKNSRSKPKRGKRKRQRKRNRKQSQVINRLRSKQPGYEDRNYDYERRGGYVDDEEEYYDAKRRRKSRLGVYRDEEEYFDDNNDDGYYYTKRGRSHRRRLDEDERFENKNGYYMSDRTGARRRPVEKERFYGDDRRDRGSRRRYYYDDEYDNGRRIYRGKEIYKDDVGYYTREYRPNPRRVSNYKEYDDRGLLYYIYPVRKTGNGRKQYDNDDDDDDGRRGPPRRYPADNDERRGSSTNPRRPTTNNQDGNDHYYPRRPVVGSGRYDGDDDEEDRRGYTRYGPPQEVRGYGSSRPGTQEVRGRDRMPKPNTPSRNYEDDDGRRISSGSNPFVPNNDRRRPYGNRGDDYYAEMERRRMEERKKTAELQRKRQLERMAPRVNQKIQSLRHHLQGVLRHYTETLAQNEQVYKEIFNGTRYDLMEGMGDVYTDLNEANDDIYDAVMGSSHTARTIFMKAHKDRDALINGKPRDEPVIDMKKAEEMLKDRSFRQNHQKAQMEKRYVETNGRHFKMLEMKYNQAMARLQQVKEHFKERYDHETVLNLFSNMRASIEYVNEELACTHNLRPLRRDKIYIDQAKKEIEVAKKAIKASRTAVQSGQVKFMEINGLYRKWEREKEQDDRRRQRDQISRKLPRVSGRLNDQSSPKRIQEKGRGRLNNRRRLRNQRRGSRRHRGKRDADLDPAEFNRLKRLIQESRMHSAQLNRTAVFVQKSLERPIMLGKAAIARGDRKAPMVQLSPLTLKLRGNVKDMFMTLDDLRIYVDNQPEIVLEKRCSDNIIEGSGMGDGDDEDFECVEIDAGKVINNGVVNSDDDDDFTFEDDDNESTKEIESHSNPMKAFGVRLRSYSSRLLRKSELVHDSARRVLTKATSGLRNLQVIAFGKSLVLKKDVQSNLVVLRSDAEDVKTTLTRISEKLDRVKEVDFERLKSTAMTAIKRAKEKGSVPVTKTPEPTTVEGTGKKEGEVSHSELYKTGREIKSNREDMKYLQDLAVNVYSRSCNKMDKIHNNISALMQKVEQARSMLSSLQLSMSKTSDSPIPVKVPPTPESVPSSLVTTVDVCIKPKSLDGTVLYVQGNQSSSYKLTLDDGELTATVYDDDDDEMDSVSLDDDLEQDKWYTIRLSRSGRTLSLSAKGQDENEVFQESTEVKSMALLQPPSFAKSFIGGIPDGMEISGDPWQGCVGEFVLNGRSLSIFQPALDGQQPALCEDNCISQDKNLTWSFDGDGFVHYAPQARENIESISINFKTTQPTGAVLSAVNRRWRFNLLVVVDNGAVRIETADEILISLNNTLNDGKLHRLKIEFKARRMKPELDGNEEAFSVDNSRSEMYRVVKDGILLGSLVSEDRSYLNDKYRPLIGCVGRLVINGNPMIPADASEVYRAHYGRCQLKTVWQSCSHFTSTSTPINLGSVEDSNLIYLLVERNGTGPVMLYDKEDNYKITILMTEDGLDISGNDEEAVLLKTGDEEATPRDPFTLLTINDDGKVVEISGFGQSTTIAYNDGWWNTADTDTPHIISLGQPREEDEEEERQPFTGSLSQLVIEGRLYDLTKYHVENKIDNCRRRLSTKIPKTPKIVHEEKKFCS